MFQTAGVWFSVGFHPLSTLFSPYLELQPSFLSWRSTGPCRSTWSGLMQWWRRENPTSSPCWSGPTWAFTWGSARTGYGTAGGCWQVGCGQGCSKMSCAGRATWSLLASRSSLCVSSGTGILSDRQRLGCGDVFSFGCGTLGTKEGCGKVGFSVSS